MTMNQNDQIVRILLVGDSGVGKTSMIYSLVFEEFHESVPAKIHEISIPGEITPANIPTVIVDYSAQTQTEIELIDEIKKASVICVVYSVEDDATIQKVTIKILMKRNHNDVSMIFISTYWLPNIRKALGENHHVPVILVGNKSDAVECSSIDSVLHFLHQYKEIEISAECSAKTFDNLIEIFYYAQKSVLHPLTPIYYQEENTISDQCMVALKRIFKICDQDNDGILNDLELNNFQVYSFGSYLLSQTFDDIKYILKSMIPDGVSENGITFSGFIKLLTFFIQRGHHELIWIILRKFGYNNHLGLDDQYLNPDIKIPEDCFIELSSRGYSFLSDTFKKFDKDNDGALSPNELNELFSCCDAPPKWSSECDYRYCVHTNEKSWLSLQGFLSIWTLTTFIDLKQTLKYLSMFGYTFVTGEKNPISAFQLIKDNRLDLHEKQTPRNVFLCHLIGPKGCGKSSFMRRFLHHNIKINNNNNHPQQHQLNQKNQSFKNSNHDDNEPKNMMAINYNDFVVNKITIYAEDKYLIIKEIDILVSNQTLKQAELFCDVCCLMYDQSNNSSFAIIASVFNKYFQDSKLPILLVASKKDLPIVRQQFPIQPEEFCVLNKLTPLHKFSSISFENQSSREALESMRN
ncbi:Mitochondrial Rho GTPase 1 [Sarcoptes scabiei]|uniref:Mitochondrial Rho GTPase n=1 Tax=Sarcoptes scabiei TaxID=52283 RepID=A0A834R7G3_SARSC|nr:Mitochondrial Rho GTPase 1 [Sarcoptes scabiei]